VLREALDVAHQHRVDDDLGDPNDAVQAIGLLLALGKLRRTSHRT
jgi:hypothetical protein